MSKEERVPNSGTPGHSAQTNQRDNIAEGYAEIVRRAEEQQPGINELLELYGQFQEGFELSQEYLQLTQQTFYTSTSSTSSPTP